jgi:predicted ABC-type ATPase
LNPPVFTIIAGSNGSGKSTLSSYSREIFQDEPVLDPDAFAKSARIISNRDESRIEAGRLVLKRAEELLTARQDFTVETTLSGTTYLRMAARAKDLGFFVTVFFVGTASVEINIERIRVRVEKGGHDVLEEDQRRRYPRTLMNMKRLLPEADLVIILDNSTSAGYVPIAYGMKGNMHWDEPIPKWAALLKD